jgi:hypothetical protein
VAATAWVNSEAGRACSPTLDPIATVLVGMNSLFSQTSG